jgi:hypothetical protein
MLIHVTATHSADNCPGYNLELIPNVVKGLKAREKIAKKYGVKLLGLWSSAPGHTFYYMVEAASSHDVDLFVNEAVPFKQEYTLTPVISAEELVKLGQELAARG